MTYNMTISNKGPLPIPYIYRVGNETFVAQQLFQDRPIHADVLMIGASSTGQLVVHCTKCDYIIQPSIDLEIEFAGAEKPTKTE